MRTRSLYLLLLTSLWFLSPALAQDGPDYPWGRPQPAPSIVSGLGESAVDRHQGEFTHEIPIEVPPYHGIEPKLALKYASQNGQGFVGLGWALTGVGQIVRVGPRHGTATYRTGDIFVLDGQDLVSCAEAPKSPSCRNGGAFSTKIESHARIQRVPGNRWLVTEPSGKQAIYGPVYKTSRGTLRWGLVLTRDPSGNTVDYVWACGGGDCFPASARYNGVVVSFFRELRPDISSFATGGSPLGRTSYRLKTIDVRIGLARARAYKLSYGLTEESHQSVLRSVQMFGTDAVLAPANTAPTACGAFDPNAICVTGGSHLPPTTLSYSPEAGGAIAGTNWQSWCTLPPLYWEDVVVRFGTADFNGDQKDDVYCSYDGVAKVAINDGKGAFVDKGTFDLCDNVQVDPIHYSPIRSRGVFGAADMDGDGRSDLFCQTGSGNIVTASLWNGTGFGRIHTWKNEYCSEWLGYYYTRIAYADYENNQLGFADFNGDGKTDLYCNRLWGGLDGFDNPKSFVRQLNVAYSGGDGNFKVFVPYPSTGPAWCPRAFIETGSSTLQPKVVPGDFNGDGRTDLACAREEGSVRIALSNGAGGFSGPAEPNLAICSSRNRVLPGDFNGDGRTDLLCHNPTGGVVTTYLSRGNGAFGGTVLGVGLCGAEGAQLSVGDFNGDTRDDLLCRIPSTGVVWTGLSNANGNGYLVTQQGSPCPGGRLAVGDLNGDAIADFVCHTASNLVKSLRVVGKRPLIVSADNGLGGGVSVEYTSSAEWPKSKLPFVIPTVSALTIRDGRGNPGRTDYRYSGALYDVRGRRFLGFHNVTATLPCNEEDGTTCPVEETVYRQDYASLAKPASVTRKVGGAVRVATVYNYVPDDGKTGATLPYTSNLKSQWTYYYDTTGITTCPSAHCRRVATAFTYDQFGNVLTRTDRGDLDLAGDERTFVYGYARNLGRYLVSARNSVATYRGALPSLDTLVERTITAYDQGTGLVSVAQAPERGHPTQTLRYRKEDNRWILRRRALYDDVGNLFRSFDEYGRATQYDWDDTLRVFPTSVTDVLNHQTLSGWNLRCGKQTLDQGPGGAATAVRTEYDALCRPTLQTKPLGGFVRTSYCGSALNVCGQVTGATAQHVRTEVPAASGTTAHWAKQFYDGRGRVYRSTSEGVDGQPISVDTAFNARGFVEALSTPYTVPANRFLTSFKYDRLDRQVLKTNPDQSTVSSSYNLWRTRTVDEDGHVSITDFDARGNIVGSSYDGGSEATRVQYLYDVLDRRRKVTDALGNTWEYGFDSLSNLVREKDADRGVTRYEYDLRGAVKTSTDAAGAVINYEYDAVGRLRRTRSRSPGRATQLVTRVYDQPRPGFVNVGHQTSMTDSTGSTQTDYDAAGHEVRRVKVIDGNSFTFTRAFDGGDRLRRATYPNGETVGTSAAPLGYDKEGRPTSIPGIVDGATYNPSGLLRTLDFANGTELDLSYELGVQLHTVQARRGPVLQRSVVYDRYPSGRLKTIDSNIPGESWSFLYGGTGRLTSATNTTLPAQSQTFGYDLAGAMNANSRLGTFVFPPPGPTAPHPHAPSQVGSLALHYNGRGDATSVGARSMTWDASGRLSTVQEGTSLTTYRYDGDGRRVSKVEGGHVSYFPSSDYVEIDGVPTLSFHLGSLPVAERTAGVTRWLQVDHSGSPVAVTDAAGAVVSRILRRPYGERFGAAATFSPSLDFAGQRLDAETGLVELGARVYDPVMARFLSPDRARVGAAGVGLARYAYAGGDPVNNRDANGAFFESFGSFFDSFFDSFDSGFGGFFGDGGFLSPQSLGFTLGGLLGNSSGSAFGGAPWSPPWDNGVFLSDRGATGVSGPFGGIGGESLLGSSFGSYPAGIVVGLGFTFPNFQALIANGLSVGLGLEALPMNPSLSVELAFDFNIIGENYAYADQRRIPSDTGAYLNVTQGQTLAGLSAGFAAPIGLVFGQSPSTTVQDVLTGNSDWISRGPLAVSTNGNGQTYSFDPLPGLSTPVTAGTSHTYTWGEWTGR